MKKLAFFTSKDTMMIVENNTTISFLSIFKLKKEYNLETATPEQEVKYDKYKQQFMSLLSPFDAGSMTSPSTGGAVYKIIKYSNKKSMLQKYQLEKYKNTSKLFLDDEDSESKNYFEEEKEKFMINEIVANDFYFEENYLSVRTYLGKKEIIEILGKTPYNIFKNMTTETYAKHSRKIEFLARTHQKSYDEYFIEQEDISPDTFLKLLARLSLTPDTTTINDFSFFENQINLFKDTENLQISITEVEGDKLDTYIIISDNSIIINSKDTHYKDKYIAVFAGEKVIYNQNEDGSFKVSVASENQVQSIYENLAPYKINIGKEYRQHHSYILNDIPISFKPEKPLLKIINDTLKKLTLLDFTVMLEVIKKPLKQLEKDINSERKAFAAISQLPSMNSMLYDTHLVEQKRQALASMGHWINEGDEFSTIRFTIHFYTNRKMNTEDMDHTIKQTFLREDLVWYRLNYNLLDLSFPFVKTNFLKVSEKTFFISNTEIATTFDFDGGNRYLNAKNENNPLDLKNIDNCDIYVKSAGKVQSINMFESNDMFNGVIIAPSGSGKSFLTVHLIDGFMKGNNNPNICMIIDRGGSYNNYTSIKNGVNVSVKKTDATNCINPFVFNNYFAKLLKVELILTESHLIQSNLRGEEDSATRQLQEDFDELQLKMEEILSTTVDIDGRLIGADKVVRNSEGIITETDFGDAGLQNVMEIWIGIIVDMIGEDTIGPENAGVISRSLYKVMQDMIATESNLEEPNEVIKYITLQDIVTNMEISILQDEKEAISQEQLNKYLFQLEEYINPLQSGKLFNGKPSLNLDATNLSNLDFGEIQNEKLSNIVLVSLVLQFFNIMTSTKYKSSRKLLVIDEAHAVLNSTYSSGLKSVAYLFRTARKHGAGVLLLSQGIADFVKRSGEAEPAKMTQFAGIIGNCGIKWILGRHDKEDLKNRMNLKDIVADRISTNAGREFFAIAKDMTFSELIVSDMTYAVATTHKEEKNMISILKGFTKNINGALLIFAYCFGMNFVRTFTSTTGLMREFGVNPNVDVNKKQLLEKLDFYYDDLEETDKTERIKEITYFGSQTDQKGLLALLILAETKDLQKKLKEILTKTSSN